LQRLTLFLSGVYKQKFIYKRFGRAANLFVSSRVFLGHQKSFFVAIVAHPYSQNENDKVTNDYEQVEDYFSADREKQQRMIVSKLDLKKFSPSKIRNFCIIAHVDHGKTTLSTRLLEYTATIEKTESNELYMDKLRVEKERGITVKAQTASMFFRYKGEVYLLNLIDTPGHVDFTYEVSRSMAACEGAVLLTDAAKGVQAQTQANWWLAFEANLFIVPALNKIDLPTAQPKVVKEQLKRLFGHSEDEILMLSAKSGFGVSQLLATIVEKIPPPTGDINKPFRALLFDSWYQDIHNGVICLIKVVDGFIEKGDHIMSTYTNATYEVLDIGLMYPEMESTGVLYAGQVGYIRPGMRTGKEAHIGDTFHRAGEVVEPLPGFKPAKPMVFAGLYPVEPSEFDKLQEAIEKLTLNDASVSTMKENSDALGVGFRCGFLGLLHMDVFMTRLRQEYGAGQIIATNPTVPYIITLRNDDTQVVATSPSQFPETSAIKSVQEPIVHATITTPSQYLGDIIQLCHERRGTQVDVKIVDDNAILKYILPLNEIVADFYDKLKRTTSGYATLDYEDAGYQESDIVKVTLLLNGNPVEPLSLLVHRTKAQQMGRVLVEKLKEHIPRQQFEVAVQAAVGSRVIARETIKPFRKDVTAKCYGGDVTRRRKLLEKQKEGKKRMKQIGNVEVPHEAFMSVFKLNK
jgi:elongation factor 4